MNFQLPFGLRQAGSEQSLIWPSKDESKPEDQKAIENSLIFPLLTASTLHS